MLSTFKRFIRFDKKSCIKNNLISSVIFLTIVMAVSFICEAILYARKLNLNIENHKEYLNTIKTIRLSIVLIIGVSAVMIPLSLKIYNSFKKNLKSLLAFWCCDLLVGCTVILQTTDRQTLSKFLIITLLGSIMVLFCKFKIVKNNDLLGYLIK